MVSAGKLRKNGIAKKKFFGGKVAERVSKRERKGEIRGPEGAMEGR